MRFNELQIKAVAEMVKMVHGQGNYLPTNPVTALRQIEHAWCVRFTDQQANRVLEILNYKF